MTGKVRLNATGVTGIRRSADGKRVTLDLTDKAGQRMTLTLPVACLNALLPAVPGELDTQATHKLDSWSMTPTGSGDELILTLRTEEAVPISFRLKPWQVEGMATIATHRTWHRTPAKTLH